MRQRVVLLTRATAKQAFVARYGSEGQTKFAMAQSVRGRADFAKAEVEDTAQSRAVLRIRKALPADMKLAEIDRGMVAQFLFEPHDLVVAVGQDGLVANVGKYLDGQPVVGVNPDPETIDGALLAFNADTFIASLRDVLGDRRPMREATLAQAQTTDGQVLRGLNDLFVGVVTHQSARYRIRFGAAEEVQSSSGLIVSTGTGSTGWLKSLRGPDAQFDPAADELHFVVREAWPGRGFGATIVEGRVTRAEPLQIESRMEGTIFADGIEADAVRFDAGVSVTIAPAERRVRLVV
ncbi:MAG: NAD+ kinase [Micropepsaceae bacterium]